MVIRNTRKYSYTERNDNEGENHEQFALKAENNLPFKHVTVEIDGKPIPRAWVDLLPRKFLPGFYSHFLTIISSTQNAAFLTNIF